jgi:hypothetical protein
MYGMVNQAVQDMVLQLSGGQELWAAISERAGLDLEFVAVDNYDDAITSDLVAAASEILGLTSNEVLEAFGGHWIRYTAEQGYGALMAAMGQTLPQFLTNLDSMHSRIALNMPELRPPSFSCEERGEGQLVLRYWSEREGLAPMVTGILKGLADRFALDATVTTDDARPVGTDHDTFTVTYVPRGTVSGGSPDDGVGTDHEGATLPGHAR